MKLSGKKVLLTGASGGIGIAFAKILDAAGAQLLLVSRSQGRLEDLVEELSGEIHQTLVADIGTEAGRQEIVNSCANDIDILINNAGVNNFGLIETQTEDTLRETMEVNTIAPILLSQALLPRLRDRETAIVNIGSGFGSIGYAGYCTYSASKFALRGFTEALRRELADTPVQVLYLAPRATATAMNSAAVVAMNEELGNAMDSPERVAHELMHLLKMSGSSRYIGWPERFFIKLNGLFPSLVDKALAKQLPIIQRQAVAASPGGG